MIKKLAVKTFNFYTAPARFVAGHAIDYLDKTTNFKEEMALAADELKVMNDELNEMAEEVYGKLSADLSSLPKDISPEEAEATAITSLLRAKTLVTDATVEVAKAVILLSSIPLKKRITINTDDENIIEGEIERK